MLFPTSRVNCRRGCMELVILNLLVAVLYLPAAADIPAKPIPNANLQKLKGDSKYYELDKDKLGQLWQYASTKSLIRAQARTAMVGIPTVERIVFEQCASEAKTVVAMARCAVRVFDAKKFSVQHPPPIAAKPASSVKISIKPSSQQIEVMPSSLDAPMYNTFRNVLRRKENATPRQYSEYYYSAARNEWVRNPIRKQASSRRGKRQVDELMVAYDIFLDEQRKLKKSEDHWAKEQEKLNLEIREASSFSEASTEAPRHGILKNATVTRNHYGLPRVMTRSRSRREIDAKVIDAVSQKVAVGFQRVASNYFQEMIGGRVQIRHVENLRKLRFHFQKVDKCNGYFKLINGENRRLFEELGLGIDSRTPELDTQMDALQHIVDLVNTFSASDADPGKLSLMSPRIMSIFPDKGKKNRILSPTILSFQKDGLFSLPELFDLVTSNQRYQHLMLEAILDLSGAGSAVEDLLTTLEPKIKSMEELQYPLVQKMSRQDRNWLRAKSSFDEEQLDEFNKYGMVHMNEEQLKLVYGENAQKYLSIANLTRAEREKRVEDDIRRLASQGRPQWPYWNGGRVKRQGHPGEGEGTPHHGHPENYPDGEEINGVEFYTLKPHAFVNLVNLGVSMEAVILSPHAFIGEIINPEALKLSLLSPRAFIATILSPSALVARILSPSAFRAEVLSPRALQAWILTPEALIAEVLSPRFLEPRVLSPEALIIDVLSPGFLSPHVLSSEAVGVIILSPNILSPRIASEEKMLVEVLSPHILGGPHSEEEETHEVLEVGAKSETDHESEGHNHGHSHGTGTASGHHTDTHGQNPLSQLFLPFPH